MADNAVARIVAGLDDEDLVRVKAVSELGEGTFEIVVHDLRVGADYLIVSRSDYWDFMGHLLDHTDWVVGRLRPDAVTARRSA